MKLVQAAAMAAAIGMLTPLAPADAHVYPGGAWRRVTAYCDHGYTASGWWTRWGSVAAGQRVPFGTRLYISGYGYGIVRDRGGAIYGSRLDVWFPTCRQAWNWGVRYVRVWNVH